jgi:hypothetical protein
MSLRWTIKLNGSRAVDRKSTTPVVSTFVPTVKSAKAALKSERQKPPGEWSPGALLGWAMECYYNRFKRDWSFTADKTAEYYTSMVRLVARVGAEDAHDAIQVILGPQFKWVTFPTGALMNEHFYKNFLEQVVLTERDKKQETRHGEQAEWRGNREGKSREVSPAEFFGE